MALYILVSTFVTLSHAVFGVIYVTFVTKDVRQGFRLSFKLNVTHGVSKRVINVSQLSEKVSQKVWQKKSHPKRCHRYNTMCHKRCHRYNTMCHERCHIKCHIMCHIKCHKMCDKWCHIECHKRYDKRCHTCVTLLYKWSQVFKSRDGDRCDTSSG